MLKSKTILSAVASLLFASSAAQAAPITFNFGGGSNTEDTILLSESGLNLTVRGFTGFNSATYTATGVAGTANDINRQNAGNGWGIGGGTSGGQLGGSKAIEFDFGTTQVRLLQHVAFETGPEQATYTIYAGLVPSTTPVLAADPGAQATAFGDGINPISFIPAASRFVFQGGLDGVRIQSITVGLVEPVAVSSPATMGLLLTGIGAFAALRRRRAV